MQEEAIFTMGKKTRKVMTDGEAGAGLSGREGPGQLELGHLALLPCQTCLVCGETTLQKISPKANVGVTSECTANLSSVGVNVGVSWKCVVG